MIWHCYDYILEKCNICILDMTRSISDIKLHFDIIMFTFVIILKLCVINKFSETD